MNCNEEQKSIVEEVKDTDKPVCSIIKSYLKNYLPSNLSIVGLHKSINGIKDKSQRLIIIKKESEFKESLDVSDVKAVIAIRKNGWLYEKWGDFERVKNKKVLFDKIREKEQQITKKKSKIVCCCLAIMDRIPEKIDSHDYVGKTKYLLKPYEYFVLSNHQNYEPHPKLKNDWKNLLKKLKSNVRINSKI